MEHGDQHREMGSPDLPQHVRANRRVRPSSVTLCSPQPFPSLCPGVPYPVARVVPALARYGHLFGHYRRVGRVPGKAWATTRPAGQRWWTVAGSVAVERSRKVSDLGLACRRVAGPNPRGIRHRTVRAPGGPAGVSGGSAEQGPRPPGQPVQLGLLPLVGVPAKSDRTAKRPTRRSAVAPAQVSGGPTESRLRMGMGTRWTVASGSVRSRRWSIWANSTSTALRPSS